MATYYQSTMADVRNWFRIISFLVLSLSLQHTQRKMFLQNNMNLITKIINPPDCRFVALFRAPACTFG